MILRTAVFYDPQVAQQLNLASGKTDSARGDVLRLVQKTNNLLNEADMHIQLMVKVMEWPTNVTDVEKHLKSLLPESVPGSQEDGNLTEFVLILADYNPRDVVQFLKWNPKSCGNPFPFVARISASNAGSVLKTVDQIVANMARAPLTALGVEREKCIDKSALLKLPGCALDRLNDRQNSGDFSCLTEAPVPMDFADPICNNSIREAGEQCDCGSKDVVCRKDCDMSRCQSFTSPDPIAAGGGAQADGSSSITEDPKAEKSSTTLFIGIAVICVLLVVFLIAVLLYYLRHRGRRVPVLLPVEKKSSLRVKSQRSEIQATPVDPVPSPSVTQPKSGNNRPLK